MGTKAPGGGGKNPNDIRTGGGFWELNLKDNLTGALSKIGAKVKAFGAGLSKIGGGALAGGAALGAGPLGLLFGGGSRLADTAKLARQFQLPIALVGKFRDAAEKAGVSIDEVMSDTSGRFTDLLKNAKPIDEGEAKAALKIQEDFNDSIRALQDALTPLLKLIAPVVSEVAKFVEENAGAVKILAGVGAALVGVGAAFSLLGPAVTLVGGAVGLLGTAIGAILSPVGLVVGAVGGLGYLFATQTEAGQQMTSRIGEGFREVADVATTAWGGIVAAFQKGDLSAVWSITCATLKTAWAGTVLFLQERWVWFKGVFVDGFKDAVAGIKLLFWDAAAGILKAFSSVIGPIVKKAAELLDAVGAESVAKKLNALDLSPENIDRNRDAIKRGIVLDRQKQQAEDNAARDADLAAARQRLADAKNELNAQVAAAKAGAGAANGMTKEELDRFNDPKHGPKGMAMGNSFAAAKGGFNVSSALQQFGYGEQVSEQTELMRALVNGEGKLPDKIGEVIAAALKLQ